MDHTTYKWLCAHPSSTLIHARAVTDQAQAPILEGEVVEREYSSKELSMSLSIEHGCFIVFVIAIFRLIVILHRR